MIRKGIFTLIIMGFGMGSMAQTNLQNLAKEVVSRNQNISERGIVNQIRILEDKDGLIPSDPELSGAYLWGSPSFIGERTDINASQRFRFPTYYSRKKKLNELSAGLYDTDLQMELNRVLFETFDILIDLSDLAVRKSILEERLVRLIQIQELASEMFRSGETNRIEMEKASLLVDTYRQDVLMLNSEETILKRKLADLNAGIPIDISWLSFDDLREISGRGGDGGALENNPAVGAAEISSNMAAAGIELAKTAYLPDLQIGYMSEAINGEKLAGVEMGISIPLWGKPNQVRKARLEKDLADHRLNMTNRMIQSDWDNLDEMARQSGEIKDNLTKSLSSMVSKNLLEKSWQLGEISLLDYLKELPFYYGVEDRLVEAEKQYYKAMLGRDKYHLAGLIGR